MIQQDPAWGDQTGGPRDPQGPVGGGGKKDVLRAADFNDGQMQAFAPDRGQFDCQRRGALGQLDRADRRCRGGLLPRPVPADLLRDLRPDPDAQADRRREGQRVRDLRLLRSVRLQVRRHQHLDEQVRDGLPRRERLARGRPGQRPDQARRLLPDADRGQRPVGQRPGQRPAVLQSHLRGAPDRGRAGRPQQGPDRRRLAAVDRHLRQHHRPGASRPRSRSTARRTSTTAPPTTSPRRPPAPGRSSALVTRTRRRRARAPSTRSTSAPASAPTRGSR